MQLYRLSVGQIRRWAWKCWNDALSCKHIGRLWAKSRGGHNGVSHPKRTVISRWSISFWTQYMASIGGIWIINSDGWRHRKEVMMWQLFQMEGFDGDGFSWKAMGRMSESLCRQFWRDLYSTFECVGVGDKICFRAHGSLKVAVYSVTHGSWSWLPSCPNPHDQDHKKPTSKEPCLSTQPR